MKRNIDNKRLYKVFRVIVILYSLFTIPRFVYYLFNEDAWNKLSNSEVNFIGNGFRNGIILLIVFFGGKALINYIAPIIKKK